MITNKIVAAHIIRLYCWALLQQEISMQLINTLVPILPVEDEPKVADSGLTYAIYGYSESESPGDTSVIRSGVFSMRVVGKNYSELTRFMNVISLAFESTDIATEVLNTFSTEYQDGLLRGIRFTQAKTSYVDGGEAPDSEGGAVDGIVNISYKYINNLPTPVVNSTRGGLWS